MIRLETNVLPTNLWRFLVAAQYHHIITNIYYCAQTSNWLPRQRKVHKFPSEVFYLKNHKSGFTSSNAVEFRLLNFFFPFFPTMHLLTRYKSAMSDWSLKTFDTRTSWSLWPEEKHNGWTPKWRTKVSESFLQLICQSLPLNGSPTLWVPIQWWVTMFLVRHRTFVHTLSHHLFLWLGLTSGVFEWTLVTELQLVLLPCGQRL